MAPRVPPMPGKKMMDGDGSPMAKIQMMPMPPKPGGGKAVGRRTVRPAPNPRAPRPVKIAAPKKVSR